MQDEASRHPLPHQPTDLQQNSPMLAAGRKAARSQLDLHTKQVAFLIPLLLLSPPLGLISFLCPAALIPLHRLGSAISKPPSFHDNLHGPFLSLDSSVQRSRPSWSDYRTPQFQPPCRTSQKGCFMFAPVPQTQPHGRRSDASHRLPHGLPSLCLHPGLNDSGHTIFQLSMLFPATRPWASSKKVTPEPGCPSNKRHKQSTNRQMTPRPLSKRWARPA